MKRLPLERSMTFKQKERQMEEFSQAYEEDTMLQVQIQNEINKERPYLSMRYWVKDYDEEDFNKDKLLKCKVIDELLLEKKTNRSSQNVDLSQILFLFMKR